MISAAKTVTAYIKEAPAGRRQALSTMRMICKEILAGYKEAMEYGGPTYARKGRIEVGFATQKHYIGFYCLMEGVMKNNKPLMKGLDTGKGVIRFSNPEKIDYALIRKILTETVQSTEEPC